jgi:hypothetical protein
MAAGTVPLEWATQEQHLRDILPPGEIALIEGALSRLSNSPSAQP